MLMNDWSGRRILIIGAGRQGIALASYLAAHDAKVIINDAKSAEELGDSQERLKDFSIEWALGGHPLSLLDDVDLVCPSGGVSLQIPLLVESQSRGIPLSNDSQIFLEATPCPVVGITGSAGKTTTTTLVGRMMRSAVEILNDDIEQQISPLFQDNWSLKASSNIWVGGNIGTPLISSIGDMKTHDLAIMELSSFQLELMTISPQIAAVLNITPNHLDRHRTMDSYISAKTRILKYQSSDDWAVLGKEDLGSRGLIEYVSGSLVSFGLKEPPQEHAATFPRGEEIILRRIDNSETTVMLREEIFLRGEHNLLNVLASCAVGYCIGIPVKPMRLGVEGFKGIPHRLEFVRTWGGASWFNDSIATSPDRAIAAMRSFNEPIILLAGGKDKDLSWDDFARVVQQRVSHLIVFGEAAERILESFSEENMNDSSKQKILCDLIRCRNLKEAVETASRVTFPGSVVLFSPGGTSYDEFRDFEDRGEAFRKCVMQLQ